MTGPELKQLRADIGDAIGRRLSVAHMAKLCGLAPKNGADTWRKWEDSDGPSGPVAVLVSLFALASDRHPISHAIEDAAFSEAAERKFREMMRAEILRRLGSWG